jgi:PPOX class probable F420-dependent enzyme
MSTSVLDTWRAPGATGYDTAAGRTMERILPMLTGERVVWLSTVRPDGTPHLVPTWFWWDGRDIVVFSKPGAAKVRNLRANPRLMVAVGDPGDDFSVGLIEARAVIADGPAAVPDEFFDKYASELGRGGLVPDTFRELYTQTIRIAPTRFLAWHGRSDRHDATAIGPAHASRQPAGVRIRVAAALDRVSMHLRRVSGPRTSAVTA